MAGSSGSDPAGRRRALSRPAMGVFKHEAAAVDPEGRRIYLTEDLMDGVPLHAGALARPLGGPARDRTVGRGGKVSWSEVPDPGARRVQTRDQVRGSTRFKRAEGIWHDDGVVYISTTGDHRVHAYDIASERIDVIYDGLGDGPTPLLRRPAHREPGGRGVRLRGHRDRRDRHRADRPRGPRVEVPLRDRAGSRGARSSRA